MHHVNPSPLLDPSWPITSILTTVGEYAAGVGLIALGVSMVCIVVAMLLRPRTVPALGRTIVWAFSVTAIGLGLWLLILVLSTVGGGA